VRPANLVNTWQRRIELLLEDMRSQNAATLEAVIATRHELGERIAELDRSLSSRIGVLEVAVRINSEDIRQNSKDIRQNTVDIRQNTVDIRRCSDNIQRVEVKLDTKADASALVDLESRVSRTR
jgi:hypothetical protein